VRVVGHKVELFAKLKAQVCGDLFWDVCAAVQTYGTENISGSRRMQTHLVCLPEVELPEFKENNQTVHESWRDVYVIAIRSTNASFHGLDLLDDGSKPFTVLGVKTDLCTWIKPKQLEDAEVCG